MLVSFCVSVLPALIIVVTVVGLVCLSVCLLPLQLAPQWFATYLGAPPLTRTHVPSTPWFPCHAVNALGFGWCKLQTTLNSGISTLHTFNYVYALV